MRGLKHDGCKVDGAHSVDLHPTSVVSLMRKKTTCFNGAVHEADDLANAAAQEYVESSTSGPRNFVEISAKCGGR